MGEGVGEREGEKSLLARIGDGIKGLKLRDDTSSEERYINRSLEIRRLVRDWMIESVGQHFDSWEEMGAKAGNYCKRMGLKDGASSTACLRWIYQWEMDDELRIYVESTASCYIVRERPYEPKQAKQ